MRVSFLFEENKKTAHGRLPHTRAGSHFKPLPIRERLAVWTRADAADGPDSLNPRLTASRLLMLSHSTIRLPRCVAG